MRESTDVIVYIAGEDMDAVAGTDKNLAWALSEHAPVLWVDPVMSAWKRHRTERPTPIGIQKISPELTRLHVVSAPGVTRPFTRVVASLTLRLSIRRALAELGATSRAVVLSNPTRRFPRGLDGHRFYYVTDDWVSGATMMGLPRRFVRRSMAHSISRADTVAAVSRTLADRVQLYTDESVAVRTIPNGCTLPHGRRGVPKDLPPGPLVALVGQLNERLDYDILDAVADAGHTVVVLGPRTERDAEVSARLTAFLNRHNVLWLGEKPKTSIADYLDAMSVGITPYKLNAFNTSSFPLKTLEYLASGLPVVTTDLPAARWLDSEHVVRAGTPTDFAARVSDAVSAPQNPYVLASRRSLAAEHTWAARAETVVTVLGLRSHSHRDASE